ncbi:MAG TPA: SDR family oxidoreductase [Bacteroidales bacterium]|nr:SDR family oxidoreductase [Bacteroidales bacterium]
MKPNIANLDLTGKTALITGGTMGIGEAIANELHNAGANLIITGAESQQEINQLNKKVNDKKINNINYFRANFCEQNCYKELFEYLDSFQNIDICINNAGTNRNNLLENITEEDYSFLLEVNVKAPFLITQYVSKRMKDANYGRIVNLASIWSVISRERRTVYSMTKSAILGLTKTSAIELAPHNILVNAVSPGFTLTELTKKTLPKQEFDILKNQVPIKRFAQPYEIAKTILFLVSNMNTYITGQNIIIDGGFTNV